MQSDACIHSPDGGASTCTLTPDWYCRANRNCICYLNCDFYPFDEFNTEINDSI